jgi:hypothetical protein
LIKLNKVLFITIFTDYALLVSILKKSNLIIIIFIDKLNLHLVCAREYLFRFLLLIRHKLGKANFVLDALSKLLIVDNLKPEAMDSIIRISLIKEGELDTLFAYNAFTDEIARNKVYNEFNKHYAFADTLIKIALDFKEKFI